MPFSFLPRVRLRLTEDPSQPTVVSSDKPEDVIWEPALEVVHSTPTAQGKNELSVKAQGAIYTNNPIFNHADYRIQDRFSLDRATSVLVRYRYVPNLFLGPNLSGAPAPARFRRSGSARTIGAPKSNAD
jgi:hypothetical protein